MKSALKLNVTLCLPDIDDLPMKVTLTVKNTNKVIDMEPTEIQPTTEDEDDQLLNAQ